jgi:hypothetical protein
MNSITLQEAMEKYHFSRNKFCGVFPYDMIPTKISKPCSIIINTDPSYLPGKHWVAISIDSKGNCNYFDSFGKPPDKYKIIHFLRKNCEKKLFYNKSVLQNIFSDTCGHFCAVFLVFMNKGFKFSDFINLFSKTNTYYNDLLIKYLFKKIFN